MWVEASRPCPVFQGLLKSLRPSLPQPSCPETPKVIPVHSVTPQTFLKNLIRSRHPWSCLAWGLAPGGSSVFVDFELQETKQPFWEVAVHTCSSLILTTASTGGVLIPFYS